MKVVFHPHAYDEMLESSRYLEIKNPGLGLDLVNAIQESVRRITKFPESGSLERANIRKALVRGFLSPSSTRFVKIISSLQP